MRLKKSILLYYQVPFIDINLEVIQLIKAMHEIHVLIELPVTQLKSNVLNLDIELKGLPSLTPFEDVADLWNLDYLRIYFDGCSSVKFVIYDNTIPIKGLCRTTRQVISYINFGAFDYLHFDDFSARQALIIPFLKLKDNLFLNVHDPEPHKGELEWKRFFIKKILYPKVSRFIAFSNHSRKELMKILKNKQPVEVLKLLPYTVFQNFLDKSFEIDKDERYITFFGRLSPYKGLDLLLRAIVEISKKYPKQKFIIGGRSISGYTPDFDILKDAAKAVIIIERYLTNEEIASIVSKSKLVICPYIEATQSGTVMTSYALGCPVLVTPTGGLAESVKDQVNGLITESISVKAIVEKIEEFLDNDLYTVFHKNILEGDFIIGLKQHNTQLLSEIYG